MALSGSPCVGYLVDDLADDKFGQSLEPAMSEWLANAIVDGALSGSFETIFSGWLANEALKQLSQVTMSRRICSPKRIFFQALYSVAI